MFRRLIHSLKETEKRLSKSFGRDISTPSGRREAFWHYHLSDHGFLRVLWTNLFEIAPGVWRSNQPSAARVKRYRQMGIRAILNLRGEEPFSFFLFEREAAERHGIELVNVRLSARRLAEPARMAELFAAFDRMPRPFVLHCKSGADRAGLASALWLMDQEGVPVEVARKQLHWRYAHLKGTSTGILDYLLDAYAADTARAPMPVRQWFATRYDREALTRGWQDGTPPGAALPAPALPSSASTGSVKIGSTETDREKSGPPGTGLALSKPANHGPALASPLQASPAQTGPAQTGAAQTGPEQPLPAKTAPAQADAAQADCAQTASSQMSQPLPGGAGSTAGPDSADRSGQPAGARPE